MNDNEIWSDEEYARIQAALLAYSLRTTEVCCYRYQVQAFPDGVLRHAVERFGQGAREEEIKAILLYGRRN